MGPTICKEDLINLGFKNYTAITLIQQAKAYMVNEKQCPFYNNKRLGIVPTETIELLLGISLTTEKINADD